MTLAGAELELDRSILDRLYDPLVHLVRNAVDHGLETPEARVAGGQVRSRATCASRRRARRTRSASPSATTARGMNLAALRERAVAAGLVHATLAEDLPPEEIVELAFHPGLSTAAQRLRHLRSRRRHGRGALDARVARRRGVARDAPGRRHHRDAARSDRGRGAARAAGRARRRDRRGADLEGGARRRSRARRDRGLGGRVLRAARRRAGAGARPRAATRLASRDERRRRRS